MSVFAHSVGSVMIYDLLHDTCLANNIRHVNPVPLPVGRSLPVKIDINEGVKGDQYTQFGTEKTGEESSGSGNSLD